MEWVLSAAFVAVKVVSERRRVEREDLRRGVFVAIYCSHGHQKDYELALPYLEKLIQEAEKEARLMKKKGNCLYIIIDILKQTKGRYHEG